MSESPKSEVFPSRFSTPVQELDDHRFYTESLPRADTFGSGQPRPSIPRGTSDSGVVRRPSQPVLDEATRYRLNSRDLESAIIDEVDSGDAVDEILDRQEPASPCIGGRTSIPRHNSKPIGEMHRSRNSSESSRSVSPNSVHAFADRKPRGRAGTFASQAPSFIGSLRRTISGGTRHRRPTFDGDIPKLNADGDSSDHGSVENDVCFPQTDEPTKPYTIDFDDLDDFVTEQRQRMPDRQLSRKQSFSCGSHQARIFNDLRPCVTTVEIPNIVKTVPQPERKTSALDLNESTSTAKEQYALDEKYPQLGTTPTKETNRRLFSSEPINRWSFFSSELEESIHAPELGDLLMPGETFQHLFSLGPNGGVWWLDMLMPSEEEVEVICKAFGIHGLTREDIVKQETREKVELFKSYYFVCFRSFYQMDKDSEHYMEPVNVYAVVFREGILTFTFSPSPHAANVRKRMGKLRDYVALGSDWICYALIDDIVDSFEPVIRSVEHETDAIEDTVFTARMEDSRNVLRQIGDCRKKVMSLIRLLGGKADVVKGFAKRCNEQYSVAPRSDVGMYLSDIQDHVVTMMSNLGFFEKMLSRSHSNYLAQISMDNTTNANRMNKVLSKVTFIATILVPLNLVCGMFGMNVPVPGRETNGLGWFFGIFGFIVFFICVATVVAKRMRLL